MIPGRNPSEASSVAWLAIPALGAAVVFFFFRLSARRRFFRVHDIPQGPHDPLWGHLKLVGEYTQKIKSTYIQAPWTEMKQDFGLPDIFYMDMWPLGPQFIVCSSPDAAAMVTTVTAFPQSDVVRDFFAPTVGQTFIESTNGPLWKELHHMLAPGLTPTATRTYHDLIFHEAKSLYDRIQRLAVSGEVADIASTLGMYPFSVIWQIFFADKPDPSLGRYEASKRLNDIGGPNAMPLNPIKRWQIQREQATIVRRLDKEIKAMILARFAKLTSQKTLPTRANASCLLDRMLLEHMQASPGLPLDDRVLRLILENAKGFLVAGYSTTTDATSYALMLLWAFPEALGKLREEHDRVFDKGFDETLQMLRDDPGRLTDLPYTTAVINETLRLFPVGMVIRDPPPGMTSFTYKNKTYPIAPNQSFAVLSHAMHYNPELFDDPKSFRPERFLPEASPPIPRNAFRPFERGLRSCLGQALAMHEMKVALVVLARWFDFELREHGPVEVPRMRHTDLDLVLGDHAFQDSRFTAGPCGEVRMKVRLAGAGRV